MKIIALKDNKFITIDIFPYGLYVYNDICLDDSEKEPCRNLQIEEDLIKESENIYNSEQGIRELLSDYGGERPEAYKFYHAALKKFNGEISYPYEQILTLYPEDFTFRRLDIIN